MTASPAAGAAPVEAHDDTEDVDWGARYAELKEQFKLLQEDTLALAQSYENACEELRDEEERQEILVRKLAEIRVRRMNTFLKVPENGKMLYMEQSRAAMRRRYPLGPRREIRRLLEDAWDVLTDAEQQEWNAKFKSLLEQATKQQQLNNPSRRRPARSNTMKKQVRISTTPVAAQPATTRAKPPAKPKPVKRKALSASPVSEVSTATVENKKRKTQPTKKASSDASKASVIDDGKVSEAVTKKTATEASSVKTSSTPKKTTKQATALEGGAETPKKTPPKKKVKNGVGEGDSDVGVTGQAKEITKASLAKPKKSPTPRPKKPAAPKKTTPTKTSSPKPRKKSTPTKQKQRRPVLSASDDDGDDDDIDDDDDDDEMEHRRNVKRRLDDDSGSSGGSEEDDDDRLPTGAFG